MLKLRAQSSISVKFNAYHTVSAPRSQRRMIITGDHRHVGVDISTTLCMTFVCVTCVTLSKPNGGDNSYLRHSNMSCLHRSVLIKSHRLHTRTSYTISWKIHTDKSIFEVKEYRQGISRYNHDLDPVILWFSLDND